MKGQFLFIGSLLILLGATHAQEPIGCFIRAECQFALLLQENDNVQNPMDCLRYCNEVDRCKYFTHYEDTNRCLAFETCPITGTDCLDCVSGDQSCTSQGPQCFLPGRCLGGDLITSPSASSAEDCLNQCNGPAGSGLCSWWTYDTSNSICYLFTDCTSIDTTCNTCIYGQSICGNPSVDTFECGANVTGLQTGVVQTTDYGTQNYTDNLDCRISITADEGSVVALVINDLDLHVESETACSDFLAIFDGESPRPLRTFCPLMAYDETVVTTSNRMILALESDGSGTGRGFTADFYTIANASFGCDSTIDGVQTGDIISPNYPQRYPDYSDCFYLITADDGNFISLHFTTFFVEDSYDEVNIYDGPNSSSPSLASLSGFGAPEESFNSTGNSMYITFTSDFSITYKGFQAIFTQNAL